MKSAAAQYVAALNSLLQSAARWQMAREVCACIAVQVETVVVTEQEHEHSSSTLRPCRSATHNGVYGLATTSNADTDAQMLRAMLQERTGQNGYVSAIVMRIDVIVTWHD